VETATPALGFVPIYKDARTGDFKVAHFARSSDRYWGSLKLDGAAGRWTLQRKTPDGPVDSGSGNLGPRDRTSGPAVQRILDGINGRPRPDGRRKMKVN
jgi:hypothetical protein